MAPDGGHQQPAGKGQVVVVRVHAVGDWTVVQPGRSSMRLHVSVCSIGVAVCSCSCDNLLALATKMCSRLLSAISRRQQSGDTSSPIRATSPSACAACQYLIGIACVASATTQVYMCCRRAQSGQLSYL